MDVTWAQWPTEVPMPTEEEFAAALVRYDDEMRELLKTGYMGDATAGLTFMMATYSRPLWWHYFFPRKVA